MVQAFIKATNNSTQQGFYYPSIIVGYCLLFPMFLVAVSRAPVESTYTHSFMLFVNVDGNLTSLLKIKGFRNYVKAYADTIGVTGLIQRYHNKDVRIWFEGLANQHAQFILFIEECINKQMVEYAVCEKEDSYHKRKLYDGFKIVTDFSRTVDRGGKVVKGKYSDDEHDKMSQSSSNFPMLRSSNIDNLRL